MPPERPEAARSLLSGGEFPPMLLTCPRPTPILVAATRPSRHPGAFLARRTPRGWTPRLADPYVKESGVGAEQGDQYAARRADLERQFQSLPAAGTTEYWRRIEQTADGIALPLEVLARCARERIQAGAGDHAARVVERILLLIQTTVQSRVHTTAHRSASGQKHELAQEMEQECYMQLWRELRDPEPTFLCEHFMHALKRLMDHVEHSFMESNGFWKRRNVETPNRVPANEQDSLNKPIASGEQHTIGDNLSDTAAESEYERVDMETDVEELLTALSPEDREMIRDLYWRDLTQEQVAERLDVTDRTVRNRLERIIKRLRKDYAGGEED